MSLSTLSHVLLWAFLLVQFVLLFTFTRLLVQFLNRFRAAGVKVEEEGLSVNTSAPLFRGKDQHGNLVKLHDYLGKEVLLVFSNESCSVCQSLLEQVAPLSVKTIVVSGEFYSTAVKEKYSQFTFLHSADIVENYYIKKVPTMVLVDETGEIRFIGNNTQVNEMKSKLNSLHAVAG
ncbi:peroxiredoxin family protein [Fictibacillus aquaticus]|uniref:Thioredoxin domain-containing protein n=1 Tax=Fictibacillus aquaticus TaxID=2021314 RepID=A0A235F5Q3_9BACL|nr:redoxin domain-containing protein [Fictibacillus aquaticus]OYD56600.1 hypothetical protein CGZ90_16440 [Fictibacillus aquaticus]